jgi:signal transduction histidine kinase
MAERLERYRSSSLGELIAAQQTAQAAIDGLPDPVLILDKDGRIATVNAAAANLLMIDAESSGDGAWKRVDPGVRAVADRLRAHTLGGKGAYVPRGFEDALRVATTPDGERVFLPRAVPTYDERGAVHGAALVFQDATKLFRFDELKNNLVATVAHEFRTPLTSLRMALHLCTEQVVGPLTAKQSDLLFAAREDCERLQTMVDDLLNLSRLESGHIDLQRRRIDPESLVAATLEVHRAAAEQAQVTLKAEVPPGLPDVFADNERLQLVFTNLLSNAIRYSAKESTVVVRANAEHAAGDGQHRAAHPTHVRFEVEDHGPGIDPQHQTGLFEKFFRVPGSPEGGSGLGLFIAKGLVTAHGGEIGVVSTPGAGATFWFTVPTAPELGGKDNAA